MSKPPSTATLAQLELFLNRAVEAVQPPKRGGLETTIFGSGSTLEDLLYVEHASELPAQSKLRLDGTASNRASVLGEWLNQMPGFAWLRGLGPVKRAAVAFKIANKSRLPSTFTDEAAELRFWRLAFQAAVMSLNKGKPPATKEVREQAARAVKQLLTIANESTLISDALGVRGQRALLPRLAEIGAFARTVTRGGRRDAGSERFVAAITDKSFESFGDSIPRVIGELAGLVMTKANMESRERYAKAARRSRKEKNDR